MILISSDDLVLVWGPETAGYLSNMSETHKGHFDQFVFLDGKVGVLEDMFAGAWENLRTQRSLVVVSDFGYRFQQARDLGLDPYWSQLLIGRTCVHLALLKAEIHRRGNGSSLCIVSDPAVTPSGFGFWEGSGVWRIVNHRLLCKDGKVTDVKHLCRP